MYENFISERISKLRINKNISARDMSLSLGQSVNYINTIENKKALPSMSAFFYICEFLNVTPQEFFDEENQNPEMLRELNYFVKKLDKTSFVSILEIIKKLGK